MTGLAKVGDRIEHGQPIPDNVVRLSDQQFDEDNPYYWHRRPGGFWQHMKEGRALGHGTEASTMQYDPRWWPMTVVEVDPEPQPAGRRLIGPAHAHLDAPCTDACYEPAQPPVRQVFEVPQPPPGVTRVTDSRGLGWTLDPALPAVCGSGWWPDKPVIEGDEKRWRAWFSLLRDRGPLTDATPPREPRTWPKIADEGSDEPLPLHVDVKTAEGVERCRLWSGAYVRTDHQGYWSLDELRRLGDVTEVIEP